MESPSPSSEDDAPFYDASDDFPFYDCVDFDLPEQPSPAPSATLRRRRPSRDAKQIEGHINRLSRDRNRATASSNPKDDSLTTTIGNGERIRESIKSTSSVRAASSDAKSHEGSVITEAEGFPDGDSVDSVSAPGDSEASPSNMLISLVEFLIKAIGFQFNLLINMLTFPFWCLYASFVFIVDPFSTMRRARNCVAGKLSNLWNTVWKYASPFVSRWLKEHESIWKLVLRFGWGFLWATYVCSILFGLLITATLATGFIMRYLVQEPVRIEEKLNFDYTKPCPVAYVPVASCDCVDSGGKCKESGQIWSSQHSTAIPPNHKLEATVILTLPESEYNKNLGIFQVRVDFASSNGETLASSRRPCMLLFKSEPIRLVLTMLKIAPLIAGYVSESQTIKVKFQGLTEGNVPTSCLRVLVEQRAEFRPGAGIPEIYDAALILESELPLLKRLLWSWRKTAFIWTVMFLFVMELVFVLICCRAIILPRPKRGNSSSGNSAARNDPIVR